MNIYTSKSGWNVFGIAKLHLCSAMLSHFHSTSIIFMAHYLSNTHEISLSPFFSSTSKNCCHFHHTHTFLYKFSLFFVEMCNKQHKWNLSFHSRHTSLIIVCDLPNLLFSPLWERVYFKQYPTRTERGWKLFEGEWWEFEENLWFCYFEQSAITCR